MVARPPVATITASGASASTLSTVASVREADVDAAPRALAGAPVGEVGDLVAARQALREADLAAELGARARAG